MESALDILWEVSVLSDKAETRKNCSSQYNRNEVYNNWKKLSVDILILS